MVEIAAPTPKAAEPPTPDFTVDYDGGTIAMVEPLTPDAHAWVESHLSLESWQWLGRRFSVEHGYIGSLVEGMLGDGLNVKAEE